MLCFGIVQLKRRKQGTPIPSNDIWIAAQTMESGAELVTMDRHFEKINGLVYRLFSHQSQIPSFNSL